MLPVLGKTPRGNVQVDDLSLVVLHCDGKCGVVGCGNVVILEQVLEKVRP